MRVEDLFSNLLVANSRENLRVPEDADRDFVAGALVIRDEKILLMNHSKLGMWLQPGGHIEEGETPDETAVRETREETGFKVEVLDDFRPDSNLEDSEDLPRPFNINLHPIREDHYHCGFQFLTEVREENEATHSHEHNGMKWFSKEELESDEYEMPENLRNVALRAIDYVEEK